MKTLSLCALILTASAAGLYWKNSSVPSQPDTGGVSELTMAPAPLPAVEKLPAPVVASAVPQVAPVVPAPPVPEIVITPTVQPSPQPVLMPAVATFQIPRPAAPVTPIPPLITEPMPAPQKFDDEYSGFAALELAQNMQGMERINMVREGITRLANFNIDTAVQAANNLTNQHDHGVAVGSVIRIANERSPRQAADILFNQVPPETALGLIQYPRTAPLMSSLTAEALRVDPSRVVAWAGSFTGSAGMQSLAVAQEHVSSTWAQVDPAAATGWVNSMPSGIDRAQALQDLARSMQNSSRPAGAATWIQQHPSIEPPSIERHNR
jgi:hypothetical protein